MLNLLQKLKKKAQMIYGYTIEGLRTIPLFEGDEIGKKWKLFFDLSYAKHDIRFFLTGNPCRELAFYTSSWISEKEACTVGMWERS